MSSCCVKRTGKGGCVLDRERCGGFTHVLPREMESTRWMPEQCSVVDVWVTRRPLRRVAAAFGGVAAVYFFSESFGVRGKESCFRSGSKQRRQRAS